MLNKTYKYPKSEFNIPTWFTDNHLLLDIETTGLSPNGAIIYCIGLSYIEENDAVIRLLFAERYDQEMDILLEFKNILENTDCIITFNGQTFDIPFLQKRAQQFGIDLGINKIDHLDLFRQVKSMKNILQLDNYQQKTIEHFLGVSRDDEMSGGDLIEVYFTYAATKKPELLHLLLLHNHDDVKGMYHLLVIEELRRFFDGGHEVESIETADNNLIIKYVPTECDIKGIDLSYVNENFTLYIANNRCSVKIPIKSGPLKHYFSDYKNYYYLTEEKCICHKDLASFVDKDHKRKATREECYVSKEFEYITIPCSKKLKNLLIDEYSKEELDILYYFKKDIRDININLDIENKFISVSLKLITKL